MSLVYRFRIVFEDYDDVSRDIDVKSTQNFEDLHHTIQASIGFDGSKSASFYCTSDTWIKEQEIALEKRKDKNGNQIALMKASRLCDFISDPHQKFIYVSDYDANWSFQMQLIKILPTVDLTKTYPLCAKSVGEAPKQYANPVAKPVIADEDAEELLLIDEPGEEETKDSLLGDEEDGVEADELEGMGEEGEEEMEADSESGGEEEKQEDF